MPLLNEDVQGQVKQQLADLPNPVRLMMVTQEFECQYCAETRQLVDEVASLSDQIEAEIYDFVEDKETVDAYDIDKIPAVAVIGEKDYGIRFFGIPSGYEFTS
ncbi:MAG: thioredoxin family protein, partial [Chloroflexota bacterium]